MVSKSGHPRKKVIMADSLGMGIYRYRLSCGHITKRVGRVPKGRAIECPADTCICYDCAPTDGKSVKTMEHKP